MWIRLLYIKKVWQKTTKSAVSSRSAKIGDLLKNTGESIVSGDGGLGKRALANAEMMHQVRDVRYAAPHVKNLASRCSTTADRAGASPSMLSQIQ